MTVLQAWMIVGIPVLVLVGAMFVGRNAIRATIGYALLAVLVTFFLVTTGDTVSVAALGTIAVVLVATGRGTHLDDGVPEHHENRKRFTTTPSHD